MDKQQHMDSLIQNFVIVNQAKEEISKTIEQKDMKVLRNTVHTERNVYAQEMVVNSLTNVLQDVKQMSL